MLQIKKKIFATKFNVLEQDFSKIIRIIDDAGSTRFAQRKTIKFHESDYILTCEELLNDDFSIKQYHYNLTGKDYNGNTQLVFGFHNQSKTRDKRYQTDSDPYHIHLSKLIEFTTMDRLDNFEHEELPQIIELICILIQFEKHLLKREATKPLPTKKHHRQGKRQG